MDLNVYVGGDIPLDKSSLELKDGESTELEGSTEGGNEVTQSRAATPSEPVVVGEHVVPETPPPAGLRPLGGTPAEDTESSSGSDDEPLLQVVSRSRQATAAGKSPFSSADAFARVRGIPRARARLRAAGRELRAVDGRC